MTDTPSKRAFVLGGLGPELARFILADGTCQPFSSKEMGRFIIGDLVGRRQISREDAVFFFHELEASILPEREFTTSLEEMSDYSDEDDGIFGAHRHQPDTMH